MKYTLVIFFLACNLEEKEEECLATCSKIYDECGILRPATTTQELINYCVDECMTAMSNKGDVGSYDPYKQIPESERPELENDQQGTLWMECVNQTSCEDLEDNYCAPIW